jgi:hypothetical protein
MSETRTLRENIDTALYYADGWQLPVGVVTLLRDCKSALESAERSEPAAASVPLLIDQLADRLEDWAQNEEMIDQFFLGHGKDCNEAAKLLRALSSAPGERR